MTDWKRKFWSKVDKSGACWVWRGHRDKDGYGIFGCSTMRDGYGRGRETGGEFRCHRIVFVLFNGFIEDDDLVMHTCNNPSCVHPLHLVKGTPKQNSQYRERCGRGNPRRNGDGTYRKGAYKVSNQMIQEMKRLYSTGKYTYRQIAARYGITPEHTRTVVRL